jgi:hypothetical protein
MNAENLPEAAPLRDIVVTGSYPERRPAAEFTGVQHQRCHGRASSAGASTEPTTAGITGAAAGDTLVVGGSNFGGPAIAIDCAR